MNRLAKKIYSVYVEGLAIGPAGGAHHSATSARARNDNPSKQETEKNKKTANRLANKAEVKSNQSAEKRAAAHKRNVHTGDGT